MGARIKKRSISIKKELNTTFNELDEEFNNMRDQKENISDNAHNLGVGDNQDSDSEDDPFAKLKKRQPRKKASKAERN